MDSLATALRRIPIFQDLPPGSFVRIVADLREEGHAAETVICGEGEPSHGFYIMQSEQVEVLGSRGGNQRELVAVNGPNDWPASRQPGAVRELRLERHASARDRVGPW